MRHGGATLGILAKPPADPAPPRHHGRRRRDDPVVALSDCQPGGWVVAQPWVVEVLAPSFGQAFFLSVRTVNLFHTCVIASGREERPAGTNSILFGCVPATLLHEPASNQLSCGRLYGIFAPLRRTRTLA